jgi:hypothetical protein
MRSDAAGATDASRRKQSGLAQQPRASSKTRFRCSSQCPGGRGPARSYRVRRRELAADSTRPEDQIDKRFTDDDEQAASRLPLAELGMTCTSTILRIRHSVRAMLQISKTVGPEHRHGGCLRRLHACDWPCGALHAVSARP